MSCIKVAACQHKDNCNEETSRVGYMGRIERD